MSIHSWKRKRKRKMKMNMASIWLTIVAALITTVVCVSGGSLVNNFYGKTCRSAEATVKSVVEKHMSQDPTVFVNLLRMQFHDCFVQGCDGSLLINSTANNTAEKEAVPNLTIRRFDVIDDAKAEIEGTCPGVVSCADILALAARDAVAKAGGPSWRVRTGRRDGVISKQSDALANIPQPTFTFSQLKTSFAKKSLSVKDLVVLSGAHTIGIGHCNFFSNRLYNFTANGGMDPSLNASYAQQLKTQCTNLTDNATFVPMDPTTPGTFDSSYFTNLKQQKGLFQSDATLLTNLISRTYIDKQLNQASFFENFKNSMQLLSEIEVKTGTAGQIRKKCASIN